MRLTASVVGLLAAAVLAGTARADWSNELTTHLWDKPSVDRPCGITATPGRPAGGWFGWRFKAFSDDPVRACPKTVSEFTANHQHGVSVAVRLATRSATGETYYGSLATARFTPTGVIWSGSSTIYVSGETKLLLVVEWGLGEPPDELPLG